MNTSLYNQDYCARESLEQDYAKRLQEDDAGQQARLESQDTEMGISKDALEKGANSWMNTVTTIGLALGSLLGIGMGLSKCNPDVQPQVSATQKQATPTQKGEIATYKATLADTLTQED